MIVQRSPADKPGDDIVSPILQTPEAQIERGRQEINFNSTDRIIKTCVVVDSEFIQPGELVSIQTGRGVSVGMMTDFSISIRENGFVSTSITVECP